MNHRRNDGMRYNGNTFRGHSRRRPFGGRRGRPYYRHHSGGDHSVRHTPNHSYNQSQDDYQMSQQSFHTLIAQKPKYETIVLDLPTQASHLHEPVLRQHFQHTYGTVKKIWFNATNTKGFISFFNPISVDMCLESGRKQLINGIYVDVSPLEVTLPPELMSTTGQDSHHLKSLCKSDNKTLTAKFPTRHDTSDQNHQFIYTLSRNEMKSLVKIDKMDKIKLLNDLLNANDMTEQTDVFFNTILLTEFDYKRRLDLKDKLEELLNLNQFVCRLHLMGSTATGLAFCHSDMDIFVELIDQKSSYVLTFENAMQLLEKMRGILRRGLHQYIIKPIPSQRCPIIKLKFDDIFKFSVYSSLDCDISLSNGLAIHNSRLIRYYCQLEPRFQQLCLLLRFWAKMNDMISGTNQMSSYAFTHLIIYFCQTQQLLPSLDLSRQLCPMEPLVIKGWNCSFTDDITIFKHNSLNNHQTVPQLIQQFFHFYANFDFTTQLICTKSGLTKHKSIITSQPMDQIDDEIQELPQTSLKLTSMICIEDPFELSHNLCSSLSVNSFDKFSAYLTHISRKSQQIFNNKCIENLTEISTNDKYWGLSYLSVEWDPTPTGYVFPEHFIGYINMDLILKHSNESLINLMTIIANGLTESTFIWLTDAYRLDCELLAKWDLISGQLSPFAEFYIKLNPIDYQVIDINSRLESRQQLSDEDIKQLSDIDREKLITQNIRNNFGPKKSALIATECHFAIVFNCRQCFPTVELALIDVKPNFEFCSILITFLRRLVGRIAKDRQLLTVAQDLQ